MHELRTLLLLELRSLYGFNTALHTGDAKVKKRFCLLAGAWMVLFLVVCGYVGGLVYGLCMLNLAQIVPTYLAAITSLLIFAFGIFIAGNRIFGQKGYDLLISLPVRSKSIVLSRFAALYIENLALTLMIFLPGCAVYALLQKPGGLFYLFALVGCLFIPAIPMVLSTVLGTFILAVSSRMKGKSMAQTVLTVLLVVTIMVGSFGMESIVEEFTPEILAALARTVQELIGKIYPPVLWLGEAMTSFDLRSLALFATVCAAAVAMALAVICKCFTAVMSRLSGISASHSYRIGAMECRGLLKALYLREVKRYFSSSIYVTNTIIGPILGTIAAVALCVSGPEPIETALPGVDIRGLLPFGIAAIFCMMTTSCTSISMEGRQFWVVKSLPIPTKALLDSKIALNLSLMLHFYVVSAGAMAIAVKPGILDFLWLLLIPAALMVFSVVLGITVNLKFHSFDWDKEEYVVKQSLPAALGGFAGFLMSAALGILLFLLPPQFADAGRALICLLLLGITNLLYRKNNQAVLQEL